MGDAYKRVMWGVDPNYSSNKDKFTHISSLSGKEHNTAFYPLENTFDLENQNSNQSTRAIFEATYYLGGKPEATAQDASEIKPKSFISYNGKLKEVTNPKQSEGKSQIELKEIFENPDDNEELDNIAKELGISESTKVDYYHEGKVYYKVIIRHFNDSELGIDIDWKMPEDGYGSNNKNYLGRYGLVRNNWYVLKLNSVKGIGEPVLPPVPAEGEPNDSKGPYVLDCTIDILSWTKRTQEVDF